jgi:hypothetical protein
MNILLGMPMIKIDFVLPWVDGNDPIWQKEKAHYSSQKTGTEGSSSYRDMGTLKYVLRSIEKNCPWYNKIHLITCGHFPEWLDINHPKINLVTHEELYFDKTHLPVFSSSSIEMNLPNLREVSEQFIYLNDDTIIFNTVGIERFFQYGKPIDFLSHGWLPRNKLFAKLRGMDAWVHSLNNNLRLINKEFSPLKLKRVDLYHSSYKFKIKLSNFLLQNIYKKFIWIEHWHHPKPYTMSTLKATHNAFQKEMMLCSANKFRSNNDLTQYIYRYWQLATGDYIPYKFNDAMAVNISSKKVLLNIITEILDNPKLNFICLNDIDELTNSEFETVKHLHQKFLEKKFPKKASFEN